MTVVAVRKSPAPTGSTILTASGRYVDLVKPRAETILPIDIATGLSHICRFGGHTRTFYSVAQHCVLVSNLVPPPLALAGLLHDAAEAYVGDVVAPLKQHLRDYKPIEHRIEAVIAKKYGLAWPWPKEIKHADQRALRFEREQLMHRRGDWELDGFEPVEGVLLPLPPKQAREQWCTRFVELTGAL